MRYTLFTTKTCPKCPAMKREVVHRITGRIEVINDESKEFFDAVESGLIQSVPTLIEYDDDGKETRRFNEPSEVYEAFKGER